MSEIKELLMAPLGLQAGLMLLLVGVYSLYFNVNDAKRRNHQNSERVARIGGWFYLILGAAIIISNAF